MISWDQVVLLLLAVPGTIVSTLAIWDWVENGKRKSTANNKWWIFENIHHASLYEFDDNTQESI